MPGVDVTRPGAAGTGTDRVFVGLGSNLGDRRAFLRLGLSYLPQVVAVSPVYETTPVGGPQGQDDYLNLVAELEPPQDPLELLAVARAAETAAGRRRDQRWGPRTLDVDLLLVGAARLDGPDLVLPHPRMWERGFVLVPLADLAPEIVGDRLGPALKAGVRPAGAL